jgi:hypothetical protein
MQTDLFYALQIRGERLEREALEMDLHFSGLGVFADFETKPEGSIRAVAARFQNMADRLNAMADKAAKARFPQPRVMEAAE